MLQIVTNAQIDPLRQGVWAVVAEWFGEERTVFTGTVFQCARWARENS